METPPSPYEEVWTESINGKTMVTTDLAKRVTDLETQILKLKMELARVWKHNLDMAQMTTELAEQVNKVAARVYKGSDSQS